MPDENTNTPRFNSLTEWLRYQTSGLTTWLGQFGLRLGLHPDFITVLGFGVVLVAAWLAAGGNFLLSGIVLILGMPLDALDGAVARAMQRQNRFRVPVGSSLEP